MSRVVHFEIHADDPGRAQKFYEQTLGWTFHRWDGPMPYWLITTGPDSQPGINGGMLQRHGEPAIDGQPVNSYVCTAGVESVDVCVQKALDAGGTIALPKMPIPGIGWLAYCKDTEGNIFGMMQSDPDAK